MQLLINIEVYNKVIIHRAIFLKISTKPQIILLNSKTNHRLIKLWTQIIKPKIITILQIKQIPKIHQAVNLISLLHQIIQIINHLIVQTIKWTATQARLKLTIQIKATKHQIIKAQVKTLHYKKLYQVVIDLLKISQQIYRVEVNQF
jgi:hypothetical protein